MGVLQTVDHLEEAEIYKTGGRTMAIKRESQGLEKLKIEFEPTPKLTLGDEVQTVIVK